MARAVLSTASSVVIAVLGGLVSAVALAAFRGGSFRHELASSLWIVGALMLLIAVFAFSPNTRRAPDELVTLAVGRRFRARHPDDAGGALELSVILGLGAACMFGIALLYG